PSMKPLIDLVVKECVKHLMLVTATTMVDGYLLIRLKVYEYLLSLNVGHAVLRPSWFFSELKSSHFLMAHLQTIKGKTMIISMSRDGKIEITSADLTVASLMDKKSHDMGHIITGLELLSYDDVRRNLSLYILPELIVEPGSHCLHGDAWLKDYPWLYHCRGIEEETFLFRSCERFLRDPVVFGWP
ncbi:hypothetical protein EV421DRAFT_1716811, partial [Armillaria borealis]